VLAHYVNTGKGMLSPFTDSSNRQCSAPDQSSLTSRFFTSQRFLNFIW